MSLKDLYRLISPKYQNIFLEYKVDLKPRYGHGFHAHTHLYDLINNNRESYKELLNDTLQYLDIFHSIDKINEAHKSNQLVYNNGFLPALDMVGIYTIISKYKPKRYIEIGSGFSTIIAHKAIQENNLKTSVIAVDPNPRTNVLQIVEKLINKPLENVNFQFLFDLEENDILFVDSSHRILPNSDSMIFFLEILPNLPKGVIVHLHDIYLPYDYPSFMCQRLYSEQYGLAMFLLASNGKYQPLLPNFFISEDDELMSIIEPYWDHPSMSDLERHGGSFWLKIN